MKLEIGPGKKRQPGFTTFDISGVADADIYGDASDKLPWETDFVEIVFASHILEHIPWYLTERTLKEWKRVLMPGGTMEIWVPNALKLAQGLIEAESGKQPAGMKHDKWRRLNKNNDPYKWVNGRIFTYGDGHGTVNHPNWHRALFTPKSIQTLLTSVGMTKVRMLDPKTERRGTGHGWMEMGVTGVKP